jgi:hypothetical protein
MSFHDRLAAATRKSVQTTTEADADALNKRWAKRKASTTPAKVLFDGITTPFECTVRDISSTGAQIEMTRTKFNADASSDTVPNLFTLIIPLDKIAVDCKSMWRRGSKLGVTFTSMVRMLPQSPKPMIRTKLAK